MSRHKREVFDELIEEVRRSQIATERFDQAVADAMGVGRTERRCIDVLERAGRMSAGALAAETGLTSGAMTAALDRLERKGLVRRVRDAVDRRRVLIEPRPEGLAQGRALFAGHVALSERLYRRYNRAQLELLLEFVREGREFNERRAAELEREMREAPAGQSSGEREAPAGRPSGEREDPGA